MSAMPWKSVYIRLDLNDGNFSIYTNDNVKYVMIMYDNNSATKAVRTTITTSKCLYNKSLKSIVGSSVGTSTKTVILRDENKRLYYR